MRFENASRTSLGIAVRCAAPSLLVEHHIGADCAEVLCKVCLVIGTEFVHAAFEPSQVERSDTPAFRQHHIHHRDVRMEIGVAGDFHRHQLGVIAVGDLKRRAAGVVVELDPGDVPGLCTVSAAGTLARAELGRHVFHRALDRIAVRLHDLVALRFGRRERPCERDRLVG